MNYLKKDYSYTTDLNKQIDYTKLLLNEIKQSVNIHKSDIAPGTDFGTMITEKLRQINRQIETNDTKKETDRLTGNNEKTTRSKKLLEKINKTMTDFKNTDKAISELNSIIILYLKGFRRFKESDEFRKLSKENKEAIHRIYIQTETEHSIADIIYQKRKLSIHRLKNINTYLSKISSSEYFLENMINTTNIKTIHHSFLDILGHTTDNGTFLFHTSVKNILEKIEKGGHLSKDKLNKIKSV